MTDRYTVPWGWILVAFVLLAASGVIDTDPLLTNLTHLTDTINAVIWSD